jgi:hypothetical protein
LQCFPFMKLQPISGHNIWLSLNPFNKRSMVNLPITGMHPMLSMKLKYTTHKHRLILLVHLERGAPGSKIPRQCSMPHCYLSIDGQSQMKKISKKPENIQDISGQLHGHGNLQQYNTTHCTPVKDH